MREAEGRRQRAEGRRQRAEGRRQKAKEIEAYCCILFYPRSLAS